MCYILKTYFIYECGKIKREKVYLTKRGQPQNKPQPQKMYTVQWHFKIVRINLQGSYKVYENIVIELSGP